MNCFQRVLLLVQNVIGRLSTNYNGQKSARTCFNLNGVLAYAEGSKHRSFARTK